MSLPLGIVALGLVQGSLAALNSLGLVLLWRTSRVVNLAQPAMGLVGGVLTGLLIVSGGWSFWWAAPVGLGIGALLGLGAERLVGARLQDAPRAVLLIATVGLAQLFGAIQAALPFIFEGQLPTYSIDLGFSLDLDPVLLLGPHLLALVIVPVALVALHRFLHHSRLGLAACALGQDAERARALGVPASMVRAVAWSVAGLLSSLSGILAIPVLGFSLGGGLAPTVLLLALAPAVLAGLRSLPGAVAAALGLGVAYQACLWWTSRAGVADLLLAASVVGAVALQRRRFGRDESAARASSWDAATTPRPLPWAASSSGRVRVLAATGAVVALAAAVVPPRLLGPSGDVLYATSAALAVGALSVAVAWIFAGEVVLGHWGLAGLGAAVAALTPGAWPVRCAVAGVVLSAVGAVLAAASRRRSSLGFAVLGLAAAAAGSVAVLLVGSKTVPTNPETVGAAGAVIAVAAAIAVVRARSSLGGVRLVAARDEPDRAPWLGVNPARSRVIGLAASAGLAGVAGALYLAATPAGIAPGAYDPSISLTILAMAVLGGLGSPVGALAGAAGLQAARLFLRGPWALLASGAGIFVVVLFAPAGLSRVLTGLRDWVVRLADPTVAPARARAAAAATWSAERSVAIGWTGAASDGSRIAGTDTREAAGTPTVRAAAASAVLAAGPAWAAVLGSSAAWDRYIGLPSWAGAWFVIAVAAAGVGLGMLGRHWPAPSEYRPRPGSQPAERDLPSGVGAAATIVLLGGVVAITGDAVLGALALPVVAMLGGWVAGRAARLGMRACVPGVRPAALGIGVAAALAGLLPAGHLLLVAGGSGLPRAGGWSMAYGALAAVMLVRADRALPTDRRRVLARVRGARGVGAQGAGGRAPEPSDVALALDRIVVTFGSDTVLDGASLVCRSGELVALVGGNGAGKSTLLRAAAGFVVPAGGRVLVAGEDFTTLLPEERTGAGLAFVSGARPVFPDLTVLENLRVAAFRSHATSRAFTAATDAVLDLVPALAHRRHARAGVLSGGEQRLLAVAQTLYRRPVVLLADELTLGLDAESRDAVLDVLRLLAREGVAVVAVDHDLPALLGRADRAALLAEGVVSAYDRPLELLERRADLLPASFLAGIA